MAVGFSNTNKPLNPRGQDASPKGYNRAKLFSGKALDFDGVNDEVNIGAEGGTYNDFTLVWNLKTSYASNFQSIFSTGSIQDFYINSNGQVRVFIGASYDTTTLPIVNSGEWVNLVFTRSGSTGSFYYNGVLVETLTISTNAINNTDARIGANQYGSYPYDGLIAGFKLFNTALTAAQVADLYNNPEKVVPTGVDNTALKLWLPMQEGAGTTAYDGSGNGNHGIISGATYTHGIGAPVSQTAVIDWNKGTNIYPYSNEFDQWTKANTTITADYAVSPDGTQNASRVEMTPGGIMYVSATGSSGDNTLSVWAKSTTGTGAQFRFFGNGNTISSGLQTTTDEWQRFEYTYTYSAVTAGIKGDDDILFFGFQHEIASEAGSYIPTIGNTTQTSEVLLPQGLTTGRDITGVNLFKNVRKQGALNLDGNSWAEVHDNESLDMTNLSLECWFDNTNAYDSIRYLFDKSAGSVSGFELRLVSQNSVQLVFRNLSTISKVATIPISGWVHVVGIYDGSDIIVYVDGTLAGSVASSGSIGTNDDALSIGGDNSFAPYRLNKPIAQPRIYNRALTAAEVLQNYNSGKNTYTNN